MAVNLMMDWKSTTVISGAGLLATWFFSMPPVTPPATGQIANPGSAPQVSSSAIDIQREAARLQVRMHPESHYVETSRNPFRFVARPPREASPSGTSGLPAPAPIPVPPPRLSLDGVATDMVDGQEVRTAILNTDSGVALVKEGERVAGQYKVVKVAPDAIELMKESDGSLTRLTLR